MVALWNEKYQESLQAYVAGFPTPKAIVVVSAHGLSAEGVVEVSASSQENPIIYDFHGFPQELYQVKYPSPGSPDISVRIVAMLNAAGFQSSLTTQGLDHGVWIPLRVLYPSAEIPVIQISMPYPSQPEKVLLLGKTLSALRDEGVLLVGSGGLVHNLEKLDWSGKNATPAPWVVEFNAWVRDRLIHKDVAGLVNSLVEAPYADLAHPTAEHFYPLFFTLGSSQSGDELDVIFEGVEYGTLSMDCFALRSPDPKGVAH